MDEERKSVDAVMRKIIALSCNPRRLFVRRGACL